MTNRMWRKERKYWTVLLFQSESIKRKRNDDVENEIQLKFEFSQHDRKFQIKDKLVVFMNTEEKDVVDLPCKNKTKQTQLLLIFNTYSNLLVEIHSEE